MLQNIGLFEELYFVVLEHSQLRIVSSAGRVIPGCLEKGTLV